MIAFAEELEAHVAAYRSTAGHNERVHREFTSATAADPLLNAHRRHIERQKLGFGDAAFHSMWKVLLLAAHRRFGRVDALEIGVFKGQVISLWALLAKTRGWPVRVHAVTPLEGQALRGPRWWSSLKYRLVPRFRERIRSGDFYAEEDYEGTVRNLFAHFGLDFSDVRLVRGYSSDPAVAAALEDDRFHITYIDGSHTYEGAAGDIRLFAPKVVAGGWLVMDDASFDLPGEGFWKGYETVTRACALLPGLGFAN
ncbi:MAG TPA: class I SAM-dependent methyltransferase, partial [Opitutaceae bacterium]|nr:class I SAM-dependent methyltransferase [Opitutaceae bacterium]